MKISIPKVRKIALIIVKFFTGQGALQLLNTITAILLIRWLPIEEYAQFTFSTAFFTTINMLVDSGFTTTITSLTGNQFTNKLVVGNYIRAATYFRNLFFIILIPVSSIIFLYISAIHSWTIEIQFCYLFGILISVYCQGIIGISSAPLYMWQSLREFYLPQIFTSIIKLILGFALFFSKNLNAAIFFILQSLLLAFNAFFLRNKSRKYYIIDSKDEKSTKKEMFRYIAPQIPQIFFFALQGQIIYFAISLFGKTNDIASIGVLSRLQQIFSLFSPFFFIVVQPFFAKISKNKFKTTFLSSTILLLIVLFVILTFSFFFPNYLIWILGTKYHYLESEIIWIMLSSCVTVLGNFFYVVQIARKWIFWWGNIFYIISMILFIVLYGYLSTISDVASAVRFNLFQSFIFTFIYFVILLYGLIKYDDKSKNI